MNSYIDELEKKIAERDEKIRDFCRFIGGMKSILTYGKRTDKQRVSDALEHMKEIYEKLGWDTSELSK